MKNIDVTERLVFLAEQFDVFEDDKEDLETKTNELTKLGYDVSIVGHGDNIIALVSSKINEKKRILKKVSVSSEIFGQMIDADPTKNKIYLQWMLNILTRLLKDSSEISRFTAIRFVTEDLPQSNIYLTLFEENKRKKKLKELSFKTHSLKDVKDPTDINQYKTLAQLFDVVDPFIEREPSAVERTMKKYVDAGEALIPVKDRLFTLFIPKTTEANVIFNNFASWCTAVKGNGMFKSYTQNNKKPNGKDSDIYIIINNDFFSGESDEIYQIHFETNQIKDRRNSSNVSLFENVLVKSESITNFLYDELIEMAKDYSKGVDSNKYLDALISFGFSESLFDLYDENVPSIKIQKREVPKLPDLSRFKMLDQLIITNAKLTELPKSIGLLDNLELLALTGNHLKSLPREIGSLKKLVFINLIGNPIVDIPTEISYLDKSNGGSLHRLGVNEKDIGSENYQRLKRLLPETLID